MTIHEALYTSARQPLLTICLLILTLQIALIFASFRDERSKGINFETLERLCRYFKVDVGELIKFEKDGVQDGIQ